MARKPKTKEEVGSEILRGSPEKAKRGRGRPVTKAIEPIPDSPENVIQAMVDVSPIDSREEKRGVPSGS